MKRDKQGLTKQDKQRLIQRARDEYQNNDVEIDHNARFSVADDGVWVSAWVWVPQEEANQHGSESK